MKIGIITVEDLNDKKAWSGIIYKIGSCAVYMERKISYIYIQRWIGLVDSIFLYISVSHIFLIGITRLWIALYQKDWLLPLEKQSH